MNEKSASAAWAYLCAGLAAIVVSVGLPDNLGLAAVPLVQFSGGVAVLVGVWRFRPAHRVGWLAIGVAGLLFGMGAGVWFLYGAVLHRPFPFPGWPDFFFVPAYLTLTAGLWAMLRRRTPARESQSLLDAAVLAVGLAFANWVFLTGPAVSGTGLTVSQHVLAVAYPFIDVVILALVTRLLLTAGRSSASLWLLTVGMLANLSGDTVYAVLARTGAYHAGALPDQLWMLSFLLAGTAALHPSMRTVSVEVETERAGTSRLRLAFLVVAMQISGVVIAVRVLSGGSTPGVALALTVAATGLLVAARLVHLARALRRLSLSDVLTGLASREILASRLDRIASAARQHPGRAGLLFIDLDGFKRVNDTLGHGAGDQLLVLVSKRLKGIVRGSDTVARIGGDEFVILCEAMSTPTFAERLADRVVAAIAEPFTVLDRAVSIGASVGVLTLDGADAETVLRHADSAMYVAKNSGRSRWESFTPAMIETPLFPIGSPTGLVPVGAGHPA